jgi:hypothetical protein
MKRVSKNGAKSTRAKSGTAKSTGNGAKTSAPPVSELGRRLREIRAKIVASGQYLFKNDEEVLEEVRQRRAGILTERDPHLRRLKRADRRRA